MTVVLALSAFPVLGFLLVALTRAEESLSHVSEPAHATSPALVD